MNQTTIALGFLLVVLIVAALTTRRVAVVVSLIAFAGYNFFVLPPVHTFAIAKADDLVALFSLLAVSLIGSHLSHQARERAGAALAFERQRDDAEMARRSAETKAALVASLSHDLKTPLTALTVAAGNLGLDISEEERAEQMQIVQAELKRLRRLFDDVVEMASVEAKAMSPAPEWVSPFDIIEAARRQAGVAENALDLRGDEEPWLVFVDPRIVSAALAHIIENAGAYSPPGSPIVATVVAGTGGLSITVRDEGPGLPPNDLERVFERYYRVNDKGQHFGSGMGLAITRGLLALEGGCVTAANHHDGGALFTLTIPADARRADDAVGDVA